jgi:hypothetical protein
MYFFLFAQEEWANDTYIVETLVVHSFKKLAKMFDFSSNSAGDPRQIAAPVSPRDNLALFPRLPGGVSSFFQHAL